MGLIFFWNTVLGRWEKKIPQCGKTYQLIWSNSSAKIVDCPKASCFSSKLIATTWLRPQVIRNLQVLFCRKIWQSLEHFAAFKLTLLGRDNFSVDNLPPALDDVKWAEEGEASEITFQAAELVKMSSWNNARGFGPLLEKRRKNHRVSKNVKDFRYAILETTHERGGKTTVLFSQKFDNYGGCKNAVGKKALQVVSRTHLKGIIVLEISEEQPWPNLIA